MNVQKLKPIDYFTAYQSEGRIITETLELLKTGAFSEEVLYLWECGGLLRPNWSDWRSPRFVRRMWLNVVSHMATVAVLAESLGFRLEAHLKARFTSVEMLTRAALVHDWHKKVEAKEFEKARRKDPAADIVPVAREVDRQAEEFTEKVLGSEVAALLGATGDNGLPTILKAPLSHQILFYADACVDGARITTYRKRMDALLPHFAPGGRYAGVDDTFRKRFGMTHHEFWDTVAIPLEKGLADLAGISLAETLPLAVSPAVLHAS